MSKKIEQLDNDFDSLFSVKEKLPNLYTAIFLISDEGSCGKSTATIAFTSTLRKMKKQVDLWLCDSDHVQPMNMFGEKVAGEYLTYDKQTPDNCGFFNIRSEGDKLIDKLSSQSKYKIFDMPAASIDELPQLFNSIPKFLDAFEKTRTKLVLAVPFNNDQKSLQSTKKLKKMFTGINDNVEIEFCFIFNHSLMINEDRTMLAFNSNEDIQYIKNNHKVIEGHIPTKIEDRFNTILEDSIEESANWFDLMNSGTLQLFDQLTMETFLKEYVAIVKQIA
jgi:hypothetical protein